MIAGNQCCHGNHTNWSDGQWVCSLVCVLYLAWSSTLVWVALCVLCVWDFQTADQLLVALGCATDAPVCKMGLFEPNASRLHPSHCWLYGIAEKQQSACCQQDIALIVGSHKLCTHVCLMLCRAQVFFGLRCRVHWPLWLA